VNVILNHFVFNEGEQSSCPFIYDMHKIIPGLSNSTNNVQILDESDEEQWRTISSLNFPHKPVLPKTIFLRQIDTSTATFALPWRSGLRLAIASSSGSFRSPAATPNTAPTTGREASLEA
jgi:hypothetical protein